MKKSFIFLFVIVCLVGTASAQEKPIRIGLKFGVPNIAGLHAEYVTPARFAPTVDFSHFSLSSGNTEFSFSYIEVGSNYYFKPEGKGFYGHLSYGRVGFKGTYTDANLGEGEAKVGLNRVNLKIGAKWGNAFYFRPEIGYAIGLSETSINVEYTNNGTTQTEKESIPGFLGGGPLFNLGFGVAF